MFKQFGLIWVGQCKKFEAYGTGAQPRLNPAASTYHVIITIKGEKTRALMYVSCQVTVDLVNSHKIIITSTLFLATCQRSLEILANI